MKDTKQVTQNLRLSRWNAIIQDCLQSSASVVKYCDEKGFSRPTYYYWLRKIKEATIESNLHKFPELMPVENVSVQEPVQNTQESDFSPQMIIR